MVKADEQVSGPLKDEASCQPLWKVLFLLLGTAHHQIEDSEVIKSFLQLVVNKLETFYKRGS